MSTEEEVFILTKVKKILQSKGLAARVFNLQLGISEATIYKFLNRQAVLPKRWREPLADLLGVTVEEII